MLKQELSMKIVKLARRLAKVDEQIARYNFKNLAHKVVYGHYPWQDSDWGVNWVDHTC